jgi:hypothetical protein
VAVERLRPNGTIRIGCGAGYSGDRIQPAIELVERGDLDYLVFECLAERTIALAQQARASGARGFDPMLHDRMAAVLPGCRARGVRIVTNMGAADPRAAAAATADVARQQGLAGLTIAAVTGDDVLEIVRNGPYVLEETGRPIGELGDRLVSANAYIGAEPIAGALARGADVVICGRAADPSLFVAAEMHAFDWRVDDWNTIGQGTVVGHLLECAGQVTGGYLADPEMLPIAGLERLGFPIAEVSHDGAAVITKVGETGGAVTTMTCKAQLLYEIHDPAAYLTPDVTADFTGVRIVAAGPDRVRVHGGRGRPRPDRLKVSVGYRDGFIGDGQISYAGPGALGRARLAEQIVAARLREAGVRDADVRFDLVGVDAMYGAASPPLAAEPNEVRLRVAARCTSLAGAERIGNEVEALYTNGPAAGGGATRSVRPVLAIGTTFIDRDQVTCRVHQEVIA